MVIAILIRHEENYVVVIATLRRCMKRFIGSKKNTLKENTVIMHILRVALLEWLWITKVISLESFNVC